MGIPIIEWYNYQPPKILNLIQLDTNISLNSTTNDLIDSIYSIIINIISSHEMPQRKCLFPVEHQARRPIFSTQLFQLQQINVAIPRI